MATRAHPSRLSSAVLLGALFCVAPSTGCGDDGAGSGGKDGSSSSTAAEGSSTGDASSSTTGAGSAEGTSTSTGEATETSTGSSTSGSEGDSSTSGTSGTSGTTGAQAVDVPFTVHDPGVLELTARVPPGWVLINTAAQWAAFTDAPVPAGVTFPEQWVLFGSRGPQPFPGHALSIDTLTWQGGTLEVVGEQVDPGDDCETYEFIWPADTLLSFDALGGEVEEVDDQTVAAEFSCAGGGGDSADCHLEAPCATGLLCAGLIRNTVLANDPGGLCLDATYRGSFSGGAVTIPTGSIAEVELDVSGLASVDMDVTILLDLDHPAPQELVITLRNPDGNEVSVADQQATPLHPGGVPIVPIGFSGDESVNGTWTLMVRDAVGNANNGSVNGWTLEIMSRLD